MAPAGPRPPLARSLPLPLRTAFAALACACAVTALAAAPAHAIRVATWNLWQYPQSAFAQRQPNFRTVLGSAGLQPDLLVVQELNDASGKDSLLNALNADTPGLYSGNILEVAPSGIGHEYYGYFWKPSVVSLVNVAAVTNPNGPRAFLRVTLRAPGYPNTQQVVLYVIHFKAGDGSITPSDSSTRRLECTTLRNSMNGLPAGTQILMLGDTNFYGSWEGGYIRLTESQTDNDGRLFDPLPVSGTWHVNNNFAPYDTQCPCNSGCISGMSGGGLDDRFDLILPSATMQDGAGFDLVPGSTRAYGNDGLHFNNDVNGDQFNTMVGYPMATALKNASDHLPVYVDVQVPARVSAASALDFGRVVTGGAPAANLTVSNVATVPADELNYSFALTGTDAAAFTAPAGGFVANAGAAGNVHAIGLTAGAPGAKAATLQVLSTVADTTTKNVLLSATVLRHAVPSFDSSAVVTATTADFGTHAIPQFADVDVRVHDRGFDALQAACSLDSVAIAGGAGRFSVTGGFTPGTIGATGRTLSLHFDSWGATLDTTYTGTLTLYASDEPLPGATALGPLTVSLTATTQSGVAAAPPAAHALRFEPARPNPLRGSTAFAFELPRAQSASLEIYDLGGRRVARLASGERAAGRHEVTWNAADDRGAKVAGGLYFARFATPGLTRVERVIVLP